MFLVVITESFHHLTYILSKCIKINVTKLYSKGLVSPLKVDKRQVKPGLFEGHGYPMTQSEGAAFHRGP